MPLAFRVSKREFESSHLWPLTKRFAAHTAKAGPLVYNPTCSGFAARKRERDKAPRVEGPSSEAGAAPCFGLRPRLPWAKGGLGKSDWEYTAQYPGTAQKRVMDATAMRPKTPEVQ